MTGPGRFLIFTGDGKGKTTAALGMALRMAGHGRRVLVVQFIKSGGSTGEIAALGRLPGVELVQKGMGFIPKQDDEARERHRQAASEALELARQALAAGEHDLVILDEICIAISSGLIDEMRVLEAIETAPPETCLVLTGRSAPPRLVERADTVTEMRCVKHGYRAGIPAQQGVEF
jgi:cob(I)alamin adenosyltransferase